jgi:hypothetical protein
LVVVGGWWLVVGEEKQSPRLAFRGKNYCSLQQVTFPTDRRQWALFFFTNH